MKSIFTYGLLLFVVSSSWAQLDPGPDGIGVYFDTEATSVQLTVDESVFSVPAYLVLTNPTLEGTLYYWEATVDGGCGEGYLSPEITGSAVNAGNIVQNMPGQGFFSFVSYATGFPPTDLSNSAVVLAELDVSGPFYQAASVCVWEGAFYAESGTNSAVMNPSPGSWDSPMAVINGPAPVANEAMSWGGVKGLFR